MFNVILVFGEKRWQERILCCLLLTNLDQSYAKILTIADSSCREGQWEAESDAVEGESVAALRLNMYAFLVKRIHTLFSVLWHCWLTIRKSIQPVKRVMRFWHGYLSGANGPADATATPSSLASLKSRLLSLLPFWCQITQAVLEKRLLMGISLVTHIPFKKLKTVMLYTFLLQQVTFCILKLINVILNNWLGVT